MYLVEWVDCTGGDKVQWVACESLSNFSSITAPAQMDGKIKVWWAQAGAGISTYVAVLLLVLRILPLTPTLSTNPITP